MKHGFENIVQSLDKRFEVLLDQYFHDSRVSGNDHLAKLYDAIKYSVTGGKKLRALLAYIVYKHFNPDYDIDDLSNDEFIRLALAIESMHAYSLIHDDLPAIDNDELRRGKPTVWKKFGHDYGIFVGDLLNSFCFELLSGIGAGSKQGISCEQLNKLNEIKIELIKDLSYANGMYGIVGGQVLDICLQKDPSKQSLENVSMLHEFKTARMLQYSLTSGYVLAGQNINGVKENLFELGLLLGIAFQIKDDILDYDGDEKQLGKKAGKDKGGFVVNHGYDQSLNYLKELIEKSHNLIKNIGIENLTILTDYIENRNH